MKTQDLVVTHADGTETLGQVVVPENLEELTRVYSEKRIFQLGLAEYLMKAKKRLVSKRSKRISFRVNDLTPSQQISLRKLGLLD